MDGNASQAGVSHIAFRAFCYSLHIPGRKPDFDLDITLAIKMHTFIAASRYKRHFCATCKMLLKPR